MTIVLSRPDIYCRSAASEPRVYTRGPALALVVSAVVSLSRRCFALMARTLHGKPFNEIVCREITTICERAKKKVTERGPGRASARCGLTTVNMRPTSAAIRLCRVAAGGSFFLAASPWRATRGFKTLDFNCRPGIRCFPKCTRL